MAGIPNLRPQIRRTCTKKAVLNVQLHVLIQISTRKLNEIFLRIIDHN